MVLRRHCLALSRTDTHDTSCSVRNGANDGEMKKDASGQSDAAYARKQARRPQEKQ